MFLHHPKGHYPKGVIALARDPAQFAHTGVAVRAFDYDRSDALGSALAGITTLVLISSNEIDQRVEQHRNAIAAAKAAGVDKVIYTSLLHADTSPLSSAGSHLATEAHLRAAGLNHTVLRNGWYTENYVFSILDAIHRGALVGSSGEGNVSAAALVDYAEAIAVVATTPGHAGHTYELAGDDAFTLAELAAEVSRRVGRGIPYHDLPEHVFSSALIADGLSDNLARSLASWQVGASLGALFDDDRRLYELIGRPTTRLDETIDRMIS